MMTDVKLLNSRRWKFRILRWNADPTPFVWAGKRQRRQRAHARRHPVGGSAAVTKRPLRFRFRPVTPAPLGAYRTSKKALNPWHNHMSI